jgi:hypothetical protein
LIDMETGILCIIVFFVTVFLGDIAGLIIEAKNRRSWHIASHSIGLGFDGQRRRLPSLSGMILPWVIGADIEESAFSYGESLKKVSGRVDGLRVAITDFAIWDFHTRCPLVFRGVVCVVRGAGVRFPGKISLVKNNSHMLHSFRVSDSFREFHFPAERAFSQCYALFGSGGFTPWVFTPDLRRFCLDQRREIDGIWMNQDELAILWVDRNPNRFQELIRIAVELASKLAETLPAGPPVPRLGLSPS